MAGRRPWRQLVRLLARLPRHSHYRAALYDADDYAAHVVGAQSNTDAEQPKPSLVEYDQIALRLDNVFDAVNAVKETLIAVHSKKGNQGQPNRAPRPETAIERAKRRATAEGLQQIEDTMLSGG